MYYKKSKKGGIGEVATKLKDLKITKVDFVDKGANPKANIMLYKNESLEENLHTKNIRSMKMF